MIIKFYKYQGTGNDFVILDNRDKKYNELTVEQIKFLCERRYGIGADGLMLLNLNGAFDFEMKYFNADGKEGSMCGNGARCLVRFANDMGIIKQAYHFLATDGPHEAVFADNGWVRLKMKNVEGLQDYNGDIVTDTGSPHYIKLIENIKTLNVVEEGKKIRFSDEFNANGINVNFVEPAGDKIIVRTYERGVEDETLSCGTGVTACALASANNKIGFNRVNVETSGGELAVEFNKTHEKGFDNIWLCGPATFVFNGEISLTI